MKSRYIKGLTNTSVVIVDNIEYGIDDRVICYMIFGDTTTKKTKNKLYYNMKGEPYFVKYNTRYYLQDFILQEY